MSFSAQVAKFGVDASAKITRVYRGITLKTFNAVILDTPVLTGRARANWKVSEGEPDRVAIDSTDQNLALPQVAELTSKATGDTTLILTNNLPYILPLEFDGVSQKAPEGMVRKNVARFARNIRVEVQKQ